MNPTSSTEYTTQGGINVRCRTTSVLAHDATGGQTSLPIWVEFMQQGHPDTPPRNFAIPPGILFARALGEKGYPAPPGAKGSLLVPFRRGSIPLEFAEQHTHADFTDEAFWTTAIQNGPRPAPTDSDTKVSPQRP